MARRVRRIEGAGPTPAEPVWAGCSIGIAVIGGIFTLAAWAVHAGSGGGHQAPLPAWIIGVPGVPTAWLVCRAVWLSRRAAKFRRARALAGGDGDAALADPVEDAVPELTGCPSCGRRDQVANVAQAPGTKLAALGPEDSIAVPLGIGAFFSLSGFLGLVGQVSMMRNPDYSSTSPALLVACAALSALGVSCLAVCAALAVRRIPLRRGRGAARAVSERGWHCARCECVYFQPGWEPKGCEAGHAYTPAEFRRIVFDAGGYGDRA